MFARVKKSGSHQYLQVVHNERIDGKVKQRVIATLGRLDILQESGQLDDLIQSCSRFAEHTAVLNALRQKQISPGRTVRIGPPLVFERLWRDVGLTKILQRTLEGRKFEFAVERAVFLTVLHRLFVSGSDRSAERWRHGYAIDGVEDLELHHLYRAMGWLGEPLPNQQQDGIAGLPARCTKDLIEESLFAQRRDLFSSLEMVFFDTTSIYFEGNGGESIGQYGYSKDHRPDRKQMIVGVVLDDQGHPICCEMWPGNTTDVTTLVPVIDRLRQRFGIRSVCVVADRGMISQGTIEQLKKRQIRFILGSRLRNVKEVSQQVLSRAGRYREVNGARKKSKDPAPLKVKEVRVEDRRYVVCHNEEQAEKDRVEREAIVSKLRDQLKQGAKKLVGNKGYRKYLKTSEKAFVIDETKVKSEARFDGKWVLQTDTDLAASDVALKYKELLLVESLFRSIKSILQNRPIYHKCDDTIRGHVFCSFLAVVLLKELYRRLEQHGWKPEWKHLHDDLDSLEQINVTSGNKQFVIRSDAEGEAGRAIQAVGVSLGPVVKSMTSVPETPGERSANAPG